MKRFLFIVFIFYLQIASARIHFHPNRNDLNVPNHCQTPKTEFFTQTKPLKQVYYGIQDSQKRNFTHEIDLSRQDARLLWEALKDYEVKYRFLESQIQSKPHLMPLIEAIRDHRDDMGFDIHNEGDVLEILALIDLKKRYAHNSVFVTGGVEYSTTGNTIGELDLIVADKETCKVIAIGECKLGVKQLKHAKDQIQRFLDTLQNNHE